MKDDQVRDPFTGSPQPDRHPAYSAITDTPLGMDARVRSPVNRNWSWSPPLHDSIRVVQKISLPSDHRPVLPAIHQRVVADDQILPILPSDYDRDYQASCHPHFDQEKLDQKKYTFAQAVKYGDGRIHAERGPELLAELGFQENDGSEVVWL